MASPRPARRTRPDRRIPRTSDRPRCRATRRRRSSRSAPRARKATHPYGTAPSSAAPRCARSPRSIRLVACCLLRPPRAALRAPGRRALVKPLAPYGWNEDTSPASNGTRPCVARLRQPGPARVGARRHEDIPECFRERPNVPTPETGARFRLPAHGRLSAQGGPRKDALTRRLRQGAGFRGPAHSRRSHLRTFGKVSCVL